MDFNATSAYIRAGYSDGGAGQAAYKLLNNAEVQEEIQEQKRRIAAVAAATPALVLREWMDVATADPRELMQSRSGCCRHCYGIEHKRQWRQDEYASALDVALDADKPAPEIEGGIGYLMTREPHLDCPVCGGEGIVRTWLSDSRKLSRKSARLIAGIKQTKDGIEIKMRDQDAAWAKIADYLGMSNKSKAELSGPGGGPIPLANATPADLSDDQLAAIASAGSPQLPSDVDNLGVHMGVSSGATLPTIIDAVL